MRIVTVTGNGKAIERATGGGRITVTRLNRQAPHRNDSGMILGIAIVGLFLFAMAGTAIALVIAAHTRALLNRDADAEAANALASAENVIDALVANDSPDGACEELQLQLPG